MNDYDNEPRDSQDNNPQHPEQRPENPRQDWQSQNPYYPPVQNRPQDFPQNSNYNRYYNQYQQPYQPPQNQNNIQNQGYNNPYQYNPNSGWQQPQQQPLGKYEWNLHDYDRFSDNKKTKRKRNRGLVVFVVCMCAVLVLSVVGISAYSIISANNPYVDADPYASSSIGDNLAADPNNATSQLQVSSRPQISESVPVGGKLTIPQVAKQVSPSVVGVLRYQGGQLYQATGMGSGIIMSADGYIITNAHVVEGGSDFKVQLYDGTPFDASLIGYDTATDLAILKVETDIELTPAQFGDSTEVEVGETVIAIGNPVGLELAGSVTQGIISAVNRQVQEGRYSIKYIQTDAAINPGNSGGALANEYGQVIGINSAKIVASGYEGIGFAIPISEAKPIIDDILENGRVTGRVMLGIRDSDNVDEVDTRKYGVPMGILIKDIVQGSDISRRDVMKGDIITEIDGTRVLTLDDLRAVLDEHKIGDTVKLKLYRRVSTTQGKEIETSVKLVENVG